MFGNNFINSIIEEDLSEGGRCFGKKIHTRFPPEPNGFLHIGHAKAICIDFLSAKKFGGLCNLRMDDTNPTKEASEYVEAIKKDIKWLGFDWEDRFYYASDYFEEMFQNARNLIKKGLAYVCDLTADETKRFRGDLSTPAKSPFRERPIEENLDLFGRMRKGEFPNGARTLRAKIDLSSGNFNMRDPVLYRIIHANHNRTGNAWPIYPMYDYAHPIEDALEGITHSLCSLEFEDHSPLYDWVVNNMDISFKPCQIEFARLNLEYTVMSKRKLKQLVDNKIVSGWDDPRMPTLSGLKARGFTPESIRDFCSKIGVSKSVSTVEYKVLENCLRDNLNNRAQRIMCVLDPIKLIIDNYPEGKEETFEIENNPNDPNMGTRKIIFSKELYIERDDFCKEKTQKFFRLYPGSVVRLKSSYAVSCNSFAEDENGNIKEVHCSYHPETKGGKNLEGVKIKSTIHWVNINHCVNCKVNMYDHLFNVANPDSDGSFLDKINPNSLKVCSDCKIEDSINKFDVETHFQFLRNGYFKYIDNQSDIPIFNSSVSLRSSI